MGLSAEELLKLPTLNYPEGSDNHTIVKALRTAWAELEKQHEIVEAAINYVSEPTEWKRVNLTAVVDHYHEACRQSKPAS